MHDHLHSHEGDHLHVHDERGKSITPWVLFIIFVFGPCEPLIPLLIYPAAKYGLFTACLVSTLFAIATIATMLTMIAVASWGVGLLRWGRLEKYTHAIAGSLIFVTGLSVLALGL